MLRRHEIRDVPDISGRIWAFAGYPAVPDIRSGSARYPAGYPVSGKCRISGRFWYIQDVLIIVRFLTLLCCRTLYFTYELCSRLLCTLTPALPKNFYSLSVTTKRFEYQLICAALGENRYKLEKIVF